MTHAPPPHVDAHFTTAPDTEGTPVEGGVSKEINGALRCRFVLNGRKRFTDYHRLWRVFEIATDGGVDARDCVRSAEPGSVAMADLPLPANNRAVVVEANRAAGVTVFRIATTGADVRAFRLLFTGPAAPTAAPAADPAVDLMGIAWFNPATSVRGGLQDPSTNEVFGSALDVYRARVADDTADAERVQAMAQALALAYVSLGMPDFPPRWVVGEAGLQAALADTRFVADGPRAVKEIFERLQVLNTAHAYPPHA